MMIEDVRTRATQLACMVKRMDVTDERWLRALQQGADNLAAALESEEVVAEGWAWPLEPLVDEYGNGYFCVYLDGRHSASDYHVRILAVKEGEA